jgi:hypothetical protein
MSIRCDGAEPPTPVDVVTLIPVGSLEDGFKLPYKENVIDSGSQVSPAIENDDKECMSPNCKNDDNLESGKNAEKVDTPSQTDVECPGHTSIRLEDKQD